MAFTYTADPTNVPRDAVRFHCGDTVEARAQLQDSEIDYALTMQPTDRRMAAAICCDALAARFSSKADISIGEIRKSLGQLAEAYRKRANELRIEATKGAMPWFGGQSKPGKDDLAQDADAVQPHFAAGQFDNPLATQFDGQIADDEAPHG